MKSLSRVRLFATPWTAAYQPPPSMGFSRQEYWSGLPLPSPRPETRKLLEENIGKTLSNINHRRILYDPPHRVMEIKAKINKWDLTKLKSFHTMKETISKVKRQPSEWEKIIANEAVDKQSQKYTSSSCSSIPEK